MGLKPSQNFIAIWFSASSPNWRRFPISGRPKNIAAINMVFISPAVTALAVIVIGFTPTSTLKSQFAEILPNLSVTNAITTVANSVRNVRTIAPRLGTLSIVTESVFKSATIV